MRITIDIDTSTITADDRRVLMALAGHDAGELRITQLDAPAAAPATPAPPLPVPVPAAFASKLGEAVAQFSPRGSGSEARLPFAQQAGVRTSSTMLDDDDGEPDALSQRPDDAAPEQPEEVWVEPVDRPQVVKLPGTVSVPRELVEGEAATAGDFETAVMHGLSSPMPREPHAHVPIEFDVKAPVIEQPPVRHTSP